MKYLETSWLNQMIRLDQQLKIPYDNPARQEIYVYSGENNDITLKAWDNSGKISKLHLAFAADNRQGLGTEDSYLNGKTRSALYLKATKIHTDTPASQNSPAILKELVRFLRVSLMNKVGKFHDTYLQKIQVEI